jgi:hypothetical protein
MRDITHNSGRHKKNFKERVRHVVTWSGGMELVLPLSEEHTPYFLATIVHCKPEAHLNSI